MENWSLDFSCSLHLHTDAPFYEIEMAGMRHNKAAKPQMLAIL
jgi:hypothetical protein